MTEDRPKARPASGYGPVIAIFVVCVGLEVLLQLGDAGVFDVPRFRSLVYEYGGFWPGLLQNWQPNFPFQTGAMFLTYGFLHAGLWHLGLNMVTLWSLASMVTERVG